MAIDRCSRCGGFIFEWKTHRCPPAWWCWLSEPTWDYRYEDGRAIYDADPGDAAAMYIERWDNDGDYVCIGGDEMEVSVHPIGNPDDVTVFVVSGEMVPEYHAEKKG